MKKERLEVYRSEKKEIEELQYKLNHLGDGESMIGNSTIFDYKKGYPIPQSVVGHDKAREARLKKTYENRIEKLEKKCEEVEKWIEEIPDSMARRIFRMYYMDGMTQMQIARRLNTDQSRISRKIDTFLKNA